MVRRTGTRCARRSPIGPRRAGPACVCRRNVQPCDARSFGQRGPGTDDGRWQRFCLPCAFRSVWRYSREYTYHPTASIIANVFASRRDTLFSFQARIRAGVLEPVVGVSYVHGTISRHAILYSDDGSRSDDGVAIVGGADAPIKFAPHFYFVPTFRVLLVTGAGTYASLDTPIGQDTSTGPFVFRYGADVRVAF